MMMMRRSRERRLFCRGVCDRGMDEKDQRDNDGEPHRKRVGDPHCPSEYMYVFINTRCIISGRMIVRQNSKQMSNIY